MALKIAESSTRGLIALAALLLPAAAGASPQAPAPAPTADVPATEPTNFTPLDEIDRVRREGCGRNDFDAFLGWYVSSTTAGGWLEQVVWTNYLVRVGLLADPAGRADWVHRQEYLGQFRITSTDYRFGRREADAGADAAPVDPRFRRVTVRRLSETRYRVDWQGGLGFAGVDRVDQDKPAGAYIFDYLKDCWYLTGDLR